MGLLDQVAIVQEDYRDLLSRSEKSGGPTLEDEAQQGAVERYGENSIINMAIAVEYGTPTGMYSTHREECLRYAIAILDHLDTLGMEVRHKR